MQKNVSEIKVVVAVKKRAICILGMHRSGTSALSGIINLMGVDIGKNIMSPQKDNAKGFYENDKVVSLNEKILSCLDSSWDDVFDLPVNWHKKEQIVDLKQEALEIMSQEFETMDLIAIKDPRLCILMPFWMSILSDLGIEPVFAIAIRNPSEVALSLNKRDSFSCEKGGVLWIKYMMCAELYSRGHSRIFISFDDLISDPDGVANHLRESLQINYDKDDLVNKGSQFNNFIEPKMKHHNLTGNEGILHFASEAFRVFKGLSLKKEISGSSLSKLDKIREDFVSESKNFYFKELNLLRFVIKERDNLIKERDNLMNKIKEDEENLFYIWKLLVRRLFQRRKRS